MPGYYDTSLSGRRLKQVYDLAPPRTRQYLDAEIDHVLTRISPTDTILELGCGYGRVLTRLAEKALVAIGVDTSLQSVTYVRSICGQLTNCYFVCADAARLPFREQSFDCVVGIQNGISAFKVDPLKLIRESLRVTKAGGKAIFSSYAEKFWPHRLEWFTAQSKAGLIGPIDYEKTRDGNIVCTDGFTATTFSPEQFQMLAETAGLTATISEVDESSVFCQFVK
ncbi:MAG: class I SAM-dependent methyltransferase [candidate division Zixibacteria bacterium]|nr:class I SAM-dependent methyltransferase [candidate division Zixibacteria bacterium]